MKFFFVDCVYAPIVKALFLDIEMDFHCCREASLIFLAQLSDDRVCPR